MFLSSCQENIEESDGNEITGEAITQIYRSCKLPDGNFCEKECCEVNEKCGAESKGYKECSLETGEWNNYVYSDEKCTEICNDEPISEQEAEKCIEEWSCVDYYHRGFQLSNCSVFYEEYCQRGCENKACNTFCEPGSFSCSSNVLKICDSSGSIWMNHETCELGCENEKCVNATSQADYSLIEVIDGDTIKLDSGETVRLIGINAPEEGQPYYEEAKSWLKEIIEGKNVSLEKDIEETDQYGRLLRYVFLEDKNINIELVRNGFATVYIVEPNDKYETELEEAWEECLNNELNLCKPAENAQGSCAECISVEVFENAEGDDCDNLNGEYVTFTNNCQYSCDLSGWTVKDETSRNPFTFDDFELDGGENAKLYTGCGTNTQSELYWCSTGYPCNAIWNNNGDTLYSRNELGELVLEHNYP